MTEESLVITAEAIRQTLISRFSPIQLEVIDESYLHAGHMAANTSNQGTHFRVRIISSQLQGLSRVNQHRLVYDSLASFFDRGLHALAIETQI